MSHRFSGGGPSRGARSLRRVVSALLPAVMLTMFLMVPHAAADESPGGSIGVPSGCMGGVGLCPGTGPTPPPVSGEPSLIDPAYFTPLGHGPLYELLRPTTPEQKASLKEFQREAVARVMAAHGLPDGDTAAVETWGRDEAEARLWAMIVAAIKTPASARTSDEQNVVDWLTSVVQRQNEKSAYYAGLEYTKWAGLGAGAYRDLMSTDPSEGELADFLTGNPMNYGSGNSIKTRSSTSNEGYCTYVSPPEDTKHKYTANIYDGHQSSPDCYAPCPSVLGCLPKTPPAGKFLEWGKYDQMNEIFGSAGQNFEKDFGISAAGISGMTMLVGMGAAMMASAGIVAFVPAEAVMSTVFTFAAARYGSTAFTVAAQALIDSAPWVSLMDVAGIAGIVIAGLAMIASETILVVTAAQVPKDLAKAITAENKPDLGRLLGKSATASGLFGLLVMATMSPNDGQIFMTYPKRPAIPDASDDDTPLTITSADGSATTSRELTWYDTMDSRLVHVKARIHGGWFVGSVTDLTTGVATTFQSLSISYRDGNGDARTASLVPDGSGGHLFSTVAGDAGTGASFPGNCLVTGDCTLSPSIQYVSQGVGLRTATLTGTADPTPPTGDPNAACHDSSTVICFDSDTAVGVSPMIGQVDHPLSITAHIQLKCTSLGSDCPLITSGTVDFTLDGNAPDDQTGGTPPLDCSAVPVNGDGDATCTWTPDAVWSGTVVATFVPDIDGSFYSSSDSAPVTIGALASTTTTLVAPDSAALGDAVTLTADVANTYDDDSTPDPTGAVRFARNGVTVCTETLSASAATCTVSIVDSSWNFTATYLGDADHGWSTGAARITVPPGPIVVHVDVPATFVHGRPARIGAWLTAEGVPPSALAGVSIRVALMDSSGAGVGWCIVAASGGAGSCLLTPAATGHVTLRAWVDGAVDPPDPYGLSDDDVNNVSMQVDVVEPSQATQTVTAPPSARPGQQLPLSGAGWKGDTTVTVTLYDPANGEAARSRVTTEADGGFPADATVTVPRDASGGQYLIVAEDQASYLARSPLLVGGTAVNDRVVLSSPTVDAGGDVTVTGRGWPAKTPVTVALYGPGGAQVAQVPITTDADGNLPPGVTLTVPVGSSTGLYSVQATTGDETSDPVPLAVNGPLAQQVSFGDGDGAVPGSAVQYGGTFTPAATSDTGLPVVISVAGACRRDASSGVVTMTAGSGTCTVTASQAGNDYYRAAQIGMSVVAATATQTIAFDPPDSGTVGTSADLSAVAAASSGLPVTITVDTTRSSPSDACAVAGAIATFTHAGTCVLDVDQSGNDDYAAADTVSAVVTVVGSAPTSTTVTTTTAPTSTSAPTTTTGPAGTTAPTTTTATTTPMTTSTAPTTASTVPTTPSATTSTPRRSATTSLSAGSSVNWPPAVPSPDTPVVAWVMSPNPGTVTFTRTDLVMLPPGYVPVGDSYVITAPAATAIDPLHLRFSVLDTGIPTGADRTTLTVFRDGHAAIACAATRSTEADPDPCVSSVRSSDGVTTLTVLARHASTWSVGVRMRTPSTGAGPDRTSLSTGGLGAGPSSAASGTTDDGVAGEAGGSRTVRAYDEGLASTGFPVGVTLVVGAVLLLLGLGLAAAAPRRRRPAH